MTQQKTRQTVKIDPAVTAILGDAKNRAAHRTMTPAQRRRASRRVQRQSITLELNAALIPILKELADAIGISTASAVDRLLLDALTRYAAGEIDFEGHLHPSRSPRYAWLVRINPNGLHAAVTQRLADQYDRERENSQ